LIKNNILYQVERISKLRWFENNHRFCYGFIIVRFLIIDKEYENEK